MAPRDKVEIVILRLSFIPYLNPCYPSITLTRKKHSPSASITQVRDWFDRVISQEKSNTPPNTNIRYCDWRIQTGMVSLFMVNDNCFEKIILVFGQESTHWVFYKNLPMHRRLEGSGKLPITYCGCCLNNQYLKIMEIVKRYMSERCSH